MLPNVLPSNATDHTPVLAAEARELLAVQPGETVVDATFGAGGHARLLAEDLAGLGKLVAIDRDPSVKPYFDRFKANAGVGIAALITSTRSPVRKNVCSPRRRTIARAIGPA